MKVCLVTEHYPPHLGGVEAVFQQYAARLAARGCSVHVVTSTSNGHHQPYREGAVAVYPTPGRSLGGHPLLLRARLAPHVRWADVVHTTLYTAALAVLPVCIRQKKPCLITVHEIIGRRWFDLDRNPLRALAYYLAERYIATRQYDHWHAVSDATRRDVLSLGLAPEQVTRIYHGIDPSVWHPAVLPGNLHQLLAVPADSRILLYTGRAGITKGVTDLLAAAQRVRPALSPDIRIGLLVPDSPPGTHRWLARRIARLDLTDLVQLRGPAPAADLPALRRAAYAGIVPSRTEGFGLSAAEWSHLGVPLVVSTAGSLAEVAGGRVIFFRPGDIDDLAAALLAADRNQFAPCAVPRFAWSTTVDQLQHLYRRWQAPAAPRGTRHQP